jgi:integrase
VGSLLRDAELLLQPRDHAAVARRRRNADPRSQDRELYDAMVSAGIPRVGPTGEKRTFHSLRHTHAKVALKKGRSITWLQRRLGHSSITVTVNTYGHWERRREARKLAGAFGV